VVRPVLGIERDAVGRVRAISPARDSEHPESVMHFELEGRLDEDALASLAADLRRVLGDVRRAVSDFPRMVDRVDRMIAVADNAPESVPLEDATEVVAFLEWLRDGNFIFLGYREYEFMRGADREPAVVVREDSGLGVLRREARSQFAAPTQLQSLPAPLRARVEAPRLLTISKTNREATVHRRARMDYVGVKQIGRDGRVQAELRMIGLFTTKVDLQPASRIPILRRKLDRIITGEDLFPGSHDWKAVVALFESFPKTELFQLDTEDIRRRVMALLRLQERREVAVFAQPDVHRRSIFCLVALPRDRVSNELRIRLEGILLRRFGGTAIDNFLYLGDEEPARYHFTIHVLEGRVPDVDVRELEREVEEAARTWEDRLERRLAGHVGEAEGRTLAARYASLLPDYYKTATPPADAAGDVLRFEQLGPDNPYEFALVNERGGPEPLTRLKLYKIGGKTALTDLLPIIEDVGLKVVEEIPTRLQDASGEGGYYLHDIGVLGPHGRQLDLDAVGALVADAVRAVWEWRAESDSLNQLVVTAGLTWRQVSVLRAYRQYRQVLGASFTTRYQNDAFVRNSPVARKLVELFEARFDPAGGAEADARAAALGGDILRELEAIASLDDDRILRGYVGMIQATVRTNAFVAGGSLPHLSFKLRCADVPGMPRPVPMWEIFVYSPDMEGVHLRGGPVARGGIRWSDRREDFRTEILGLMKAQMVKNAVIVPVGAKGGFIVKYPSSDREQLREEARDAYVTLVRGMLDVTDNIAGGEVAHPPEVRVHDGDDAYLVVAADKGTAHLSDTANAVSAEYGFWLGDAFASGGSSGYDHKALGITARGAWESVTRHFRELDHDVMKEPFTVVGIGDMSGDVFGNGMLLARTIRLVAAFDHRHVFIDPDPDSETAYAERERLFALPQSSWADYDRERVSAGGGVWPRTAKSVPLAPEARHALGVDADALTPAEVVQAILRAPVDLLWNGGVGTFVKASSESHLDVGDRANDAVRVDGSEVRARVVGEGGNLGFTQLARIEYASAGGRINTDAIDNSAGVDSSDHEVNLKILLSIPIERGRLVMEERNRLLDAVVDDVMEDVVYDNYLQVQILSQETAVAARRMEAYDDLMGQLEAAGLLDRALEFLPSSEEMAERERAGRGLLRPELCVLLAYAKRLLRDQVLGSPLPDDPFLERSLRGYFPAAVVERFGADVPRHPLRREITATIVTNDIVNSMGITFAPRMASETGASPDDIAGAFLVAREISNAEERWRDVEGLDGVVPPDVQAGLMDTVDALVENLARWYLHHVRHAADLAAEVEAGEAGFTELARVLQSVAPGGWRAARDREIERLVGLGVPEHVARAVAVTPDLVYAPDITRVAQETARSVAEVAHAFFVLGERLYLDALEERVARLPGATRLQRLAWATLVHDLRLLRRQIVERVLRASEGLSVDAAIDEYLAHRVDPYERLAALMKAAPSDDADEASLVMVVIHEIRQVVSS
jgi:glutamate dehydrogenase